MRNKLRETIKDMSYKAFTIDSKTDYLLEHDVMPIVRCKDCKHGTADGEYIKCWMIGEDWYKPMHFCGFGVLRSE